MRKLTAREIVLLAVMGLAGLMYLWYASTRGTISAEQLADFGASDGLTGSAPVVSPWVVDVAAYDQNGRDLFKYGQRPPSQTQIRKSEEDEQRRQAALKARQEAMKADAAKREARKKPVNPVPAQPQAPPIRLDYIGYMGPKDDRFAVFWNNDEPLLARAGETVLDDFKVVEIGYDVVVMGYTDPKWADVTRDVRVKSR